VYILEVGAQLREDVDEYGVEKDDFVEVVFGVQCGWLFGV